MKAIRIAYRFLSPKEKRMFFWILLLFVFSSLIESATYMALIPYIGIISQNGEITQKTAEIFSLDEGSVFLSFSFLFLILVLVKSIVQLFSNHQMSRFPFLFYQNKTKQLFKDYLSQDYLHFIEQDTNVLLKHCTQTSLYAAEGISQLMHVLSFSFVTLFLFIAILIQDFLSSCFLIGIFTLMGIVLFQLKKKPLKDMGKRLVDDTKKANQVVAESFFLFKELKIYRKVPFFSQKFNDLLCLIASNYQKRDFFSLIPTTLIEFIATTVLVFIVIVVYYNHGINSHFVALLIFYAAVGRRVLPAINQILFQGVRLQHSIESVSALQEEQMKARAQASNRKARAIPFKESLSFRDVSFSYRTGADVLKEVSFTIPKNQSVAFVGPSGAGKSTIVALLTGLLEPSSGSLLVDDSKVESMASIQHLIGYVPQSLALLNDTIENNIAFGVEIIDQNKMKAALKASHLDSFIFSLPEGLQTVVGDKGIKVSGGQMQRIGIARAIYHQPEVIIFDEATSSLDSQSEKIISDSMKEMRGKKTVVAISHRLSTVLNFDCIYVLQEGRIISSGTHRQLIENCFLYKNMYQPLEV